MNFCNHYVTLNKCKILPKWGDSYLPFRFFFGKGWTIATINHGTIGREIHVNSSVPIRRIATDIMDSFDCDWLTTIDSENVKAHNVAVKCGFKLVDSVALKSVATGEIKHTNLYERLKL